MSLAHRTLTTALLTLLAAFALAVPTALADPAENPVEDPDQAAQTTQYYNEISKLMYGSLTKTRVTVSGSGFMTRFDARKSIGYVAFDGERAIFRGKYFYDYVKKRKCYKKYRTRTFKRTRNEFSKAFTDSFLKTASEDMTMIEKTPTAYTMKFDGYDVVLNYDAARKRLKSLRSPGLRLNFNYTRKVTIPKKIKTCRR